MIKHHRSFAVITSIVLLLVLGCLVGPVAAYSAGIEKEQGKYNKHQLEYYLDENQVSFIRPGLKLTITKVVIGSDLKVQVTFTLTDPMGVPLDRLGVTTPGPISTSFILARIPKDQSQYLAYTTRTQTSPITGVSAVQAGTDSGGTYTMVSEGTYTYTFKTALPSDYDKTVTHTVSIYARRDLTEFELDRQVDNEQYNWVPNGSPVTVVRDVVRTETCNKTCHDPLSAHGGARIDVENCVTCHQPQTVDPDTGNTVDMKVMIHKIHSGPDLPSVQAGEPYQIIGNQQSVNDYSAITYPNLDGVRVCEQCHDGTATQSANWMTKPTMATCGSCHDDVNFTSGENHVGGPQVSDRLCANCHIPEGDLEFDASIKGAHTVPRFSKDLPGVNFEIMNVTNTQPGKKPTVTLKITDKSGFPIETSQMNFLNLLIAGPNTDYAAVWSESLLQTPSSNGVVTYTFTKEIPADAKGSYTVGVEGYRMITLQPGNTTEVPNVRDVGFNKVMAFGVTDATAVARREVISQETCNGCHNNLALHGTIRQNVQYCQLCHNANADDAPFRKPEMLPTESIHMKTMIHKIHTGEELETDFTVIGRSGSINNYNEVTYPGDRRNCEKCHNTDTQQLPLPKGLLASVAPRDLINPMPPVTAACLSCHTSEEAASHASLNTSSTLGESCTVCHGQTSEFSINKEHAR